ncbi:hypothetical protein F5888DRAFT_800517 [Russula emetica]|nr:hypothetical protein F5888DRAFT_800517 [Russula emetica]
MINRLPDEVLLEIFDSYRQSIDQYDHQWRKKYAWFNLAHVCRMWRAVVFASSSRLDLNIIVGPKKPGCIKTILSGHLPILIDYLRLYHWWRFYRLYEPGDISGSALWRMRAALRHRDRVREISFGGWGVTFGKFIRATNYHFPALESLVLRFPYGHEPDIPPTFLRGPDQSDLPLRRLTLYGASLASVSGLLLSATALTDLTLTVSTNAAVFDSSQGSFLLACLQGMQCLRSLDLTTPYDSRDSWSQHSTPKDIVPLLKLTHFHYSGTTIFLNNLMSGLSAPSLQDANFALCLRFPLLYISRVIDDVREEFRSVNVTFDDEYFRLLSSTHSGKSDHFKPSFRFNVNCSPYSIDSLNSTPSTKLAMMEELALNFPSSNMTKWEHVFSLREFLRQFRSVRVLRVNPFMREVELYLQQDDGEAILPVLEEVELSISRSTGYSDEEYQRRAAEALAAFEQCERAGRLVNFTIVSRRHPNKIEMRDVSMDFKVVS